MMKTPLILDRVKSYYQTNRWQGRIILTLLILTLILGTARLLLPQTIIYSTTAWLKGQGIDSSIEEINISLIKGTVSLVNAKGQINGRPLFNIGLVDIYWQWKPLSEKTIVVTKVGLDKLSVDIEQFSDEIIIGGVKLPLNKAGEIEKPPADSDKSDQQTTSWAASLGQVIFTNLNICYLQHTAPFEQANKNSLFVDYCVNLEEMSWVGTISYATNKDLLKSDDLPIASTGDFTLNGLNVTDNKLSKKLLVSKSNTLNNVVISGLNNLHIEKLEMKDLSLLQREDKKHIDSIRFSQLTIDNIKLSNMNSLLINNISVSNPGVYLARQHQADWEYQQWIPHSSATSKTIDEQKPEKQTTNKPSFKITLNNISINNSDLCYLESSPSLYYCLTFANLDWKGSVKYDTKSSTADEINILVKGDLKLLQQNIHNHTIDRTLLDFELLSLSNLEVSSISNISLENLNIEQLAALQRSENENTASFKELAINDIKYTDNEIDINTIKLTGLANTVSKNKNGSWEFDKWRLDNRNDNKTKEAKSVEVTSAESNKTIDEQKPEKQTTNKPSFKITLNNISINNSDLCYLESSPSLYYCLTSANLDWKGLVKYDTKSSTADDINILAKGELKLLRQNIHNHTIDRTLLDFESLTLSNLVVSSISNISLENLNIDKLAVLQRSNNKSDNTASFEALAINDIKYTDNKIGINTIKLTGLANTVSKNKNGSWEFDKWRLDNRNDNKTTEAKSVETEPAESKLQAANNETFIISLNKGNITSDRKILFTDNSTEPAMEIGLQSLAFDISNLYTAKPDANSPFKLYAKTTQHSTINIEGTAKPFADKISFDANGKLKGFDLRVASPATKKAIGHIIQSGQLNADLKLLAVNGKLDSNIGLSLYHFNIKASSKKDAEALDAKFGMPLNQTLVLLRDKDDSIHLDIPITGDVNNPSFKPMDAIIKATSKAATVTLITFYTPYGLAYAGGNVLFNLATAMNFDPVEFKPGTADIVNEHKDKLDKLAKLMSEKPQIRLTLCGISNKADYYALYPALKEQPKEQPKEKLDDNREIPLSIEQNAALVNLAQQRQENIKEYLIKESAIAHDRLILCEPEYQTQENAIAGVEMNI